MKAKTITASSNRNSLISTATPSRPSETRCTGTANITTKEHSEQISPQQRHLNQTTAADIDTTNIVEKTEWKNEFKSPLSPLPTIVVSRPGSHENSTREGSGTTGQLADRGKDQPDCNISSSILSLVQDPSEIITARPAECTSSSDCDKAINSKNSSKAAVESETTESAQPCDQTVFTGDSNEENAPVEFFLSYKHPHAKGQYAQLSLLSPPEVSFPFLSDSEQEPKSPKSKKSKRQLNNAKAGKKKSLISRQANLTVYLNPVVVSTTRDGNPKGRRPIVERRSSRFSPSRTHTAAKNVHSTLGRIENLKALKRDRKVSSEKPSIMPSFQGNKQIATFNTSSATTVTTTVTTTTARTISSSAATTSAATTTSMAALATSSTLASATFTSLYHQPHEHIRKEETFVVTDWHNITGEERSPSENLRRRKALTLAKSNARHLLKQRNVRHNVEQQQQQNKRYEQLYEQANYSHYNFLSRQLQIQQHQQQQQLQQQQQRQRNAGGRFNGDKHPASSSDAKQIAVNEIGKKKEEELENVPLQSSKTPQGKSLSGDGTYTKLRQRSGSLRNRQKRRAYIEQIGEGVVNDRGEKIFFHWQERGNSSSGRRGGGSGGSGIKPRDGGSDRYRSRDNSGKGPRYHGARYSPRGPKAIGKLYQYKKKKLKKGVTFLASTKSAPIYKEENVLRPKEPTFRSKTAVDDTVNDDLEDDQPRLSSENGVKFQDEIQVVRKEAFVSKDAPSDNGNEKPKLEVQTKQSQNQHVQQTRQFLSESPLRHSVLKPAPPQVPKQKVEPSNKNIQRQNIWKSQNKALAPNQPLRPKEDQKSNQTNQQREDKSPKSSTTVTVSEPGHSDSDKENTKVLDDAPRPHPNLTLENSSAHPQSSEPEDPPPLPKMVSREVLIPPSAPGASKHTKDKPPVLRNRKYPSVVEKPKDSLTVNRKNVTQPLKKNAPTDENIGKDIALSGNSKNTADSLETTSQSNLKRDKLKTQTANVLDNSKSNKNDTVLSPYKQQSKPFGPIANRGKIKDNLHSNSNASLKQSPDKNPLTEAQNKPQRLKNTSGVAVINQSEKNKREPSEKESGNTAKEDKKDFIPNDSSMNNAVTDNSVQVEERKGKDKHKYLNAELSQDLGITSFEGDERKSSLNSDIKKNEIKQITHNEFENRWSARSEQNLASSNVADIDNSPSNHHTGSSKADEAIAASILTVSTTAPSLSTSEEKVVVIAATTPTSTTSSTTTSNVNSIVSKAPVTPSEHNNFTNRNKNPHEPDKTGKIKTKPFTNQNLKTLGHSGNSQSTAADIYGDPKQNVQIQKSTRKDQLHNEQTKEAKLQLKKTKAKETTYTAEQEKTNTVIEKEKTSQEREVAGSKSDTPRALIEDTQSDYSNSLPAASVTKATHENTQKLEKSGEGNRDVTNESLGGQGGKTPTNGNEPDALVMADRINDVADGDSGVDLEREVSTVETAGKGRNIERSTDEPQSYVSQSRDKIVEKKQSIVPCHNEQVRDREDGTLLCDNHSPGKDGKLETLQPSVLTVAVDNGDISTTTATTTLGQNSNDTKTSETGKAEQVDTGGQVVLPQSTQGPTIRDKSLAAGVTATELQSSVKNKKDETVKEVGRDKTVRLSGGAHTTVATEEISDAKVSEKETEASQVDVQSKDKEELLTDELEFERYFPRELNRVDTVGGLLSVVGKDSVNYSNVSVDVKPVDITTPTVQEQPTFSVNSSALKTDTQKQKLLSETKSEVQQLFSSNWRSHKEDLSSNRQSQANDKDGVSVLPENSDTEVVRSLTDISERSGRGVGVTPGQGDKEERCGPDLARAVVGLKDATVISSESSSNRTSETQQRDKASLNVLTDADTIYGKESMVVPITKPLDGPSVTSNNGNLKNVTKYTEARHNDLDSVNDETARKCKVGSYFFENTRVGNENLDYWNLNSTAEADILLVGASKDDHYSYQPSSTTQNAFANNSEAVRTFTIPPSEYPPDAFQQIIPLHQKQTMSNNKNDIIFQKPVLVRPKTAGLSEFSPTENEDLWSLNTFEDEDDHIQFIEGEQDFFKVFGDNEETAAILLATRIDTVHTEGTETRSGRLGDEINPHAENKAKTIASRDTRNMLHNNKLGNLKSDKTVFRENVAANKGQKSELINSVITGYPGGKTSIIDGDLDEARSLDVTTSQDSIGRGRLMTNITSRGLTTFPIHHQQNSRKQKIASNIKKTVTGTVQQRRNKQLTVLHTNGSIYHGRERRQMPRKVQQQQQGTRGNVQNASLVPRDGQIVDQARYISVSTLTGNQVAENGSSNPSITNTITPTGNSQRPQGKHPNRLTEEPVEKLLTPYLSNEFTTLGIKAGKLTVTTQSQPHTQPQSRSQSQIQDTQSESKLPENTQLQPQPSPPIPPKPISKFTYASQKPNLSSQSFQTPHELQTGKQQRQQHNPLPPPQQQRKRQSQKHQPNSQQNKSQQQIRNTEANQQNQNQLKHQQTRHQNLKSKFPPSDNQMFHPAAKTYRPRQRPLSPELPSPPATTANISASRDNFFTRDESLAFQANDSTSFPRVRRRIHSEADINSSQYSGGDTEEGQDLYQRSDYFLTKSKNNINHFSDDAKYTRRGINRIHEVNTRIEVNISKSPSKQRNQSTGAAVALTTENIIAGGGGSNSFHNDANQTTTNASNSYASRHNMADGSLTKPLQANYRSGNTVLAAHENEETREGEILNIPNKNRQQHGGMFLPTPPSLSPPQPLLNRTSSSSSSSSSFAMTSKAAALGNFNANDPKRITSFNPYMQAADRIISGLSETQHAIKGRSNAITAANNTTINQNKKNGNEKSDGSTVAAFVYGKSKNLSIPAKLGPLAAPANSTNTGNVPLRMAGARDGTNSLAVQKPRKLKPIMHQPGGQRFNQNFASGLR
ncbi:hypothetical protein ElyMa_001805900 [Elysia marginata]|uniref:Uncharacterized protein n=1 Tax=Elysia marginata TaxID=1093978 RepID=A0AAV4EGT4_9GAST|nr:hypothetical protein ElyMa_001805900 [Elysia marginata]